MHHSDCGCIVFLRLPEKGKVKTRLAATAGDDKALEVYTQLITITIDVVSKLAIQVYLFYEGGLPVIRNNAFQYILQPPGDLGFKMESAIRLILQKHDKAIIIGSDCPFISHHDINEAIHHLEENDFVMGPAEDGGIYLFACKKFYPALFDNIPWSTSLVMEAISLAINKMGKSLYRLRTLHDIDVEEDWVRYRNVNS
jgi:uncharacterized protein